MSTCISGKLHEEMNLNAYSCIFRLEIQIPSSKFFKLHLNRFIQACKISKNIYYFIIIRLYYQECNKIGNQCNSILSKQLQVTIHIFSINPFTLNLVPSTAYSQIIIDAYKKFILVCFLRGVHVQTALPKYTSNSR